MKIALCVFIYLILHCGFSNAEESEGFTQILKTYVEACKNGNREEYLKVISKDTISLRSEEARKNNNILLNKNACKVDQYLEKALYYPGRDAEADNEYARLILFTNESTRTNYPPPEDYYRSRSTYVFFIKEGGSWRYVAHESQWSWHPIDLSDLAEQKLSIEYQLKRHKYRFLQYNFPITACISYLELQNIIVLTKVFLHGEITSISRGEQHDDIKVPWLVNGNIIGYSVQLMNPMVCDKKIQVSTSLGNSLGNHYGETLAFEKIDGYWILQSKSKGFWIE